MAATDAAFVRQLLRELGRRGADRARKAIPSRTLSRALRVRLEEPEANLEIPHYWALYVHDGRGPVVAAPGKLLVFWKDPRRDPRRPGGRSPERAAALRRLTREEFLAALEQQRRARRRGAESPVAIVRAVRATRPTLFFDNGPRGGMRGFEAEANREGAVLFRQHALDRLRRALGITSFVPSLPPGQGIVVSPFREEAEVLL